MTDGVLDQLGWDAAWAETFAPFAARGPSARARRSPSTRRPRSWRTTAAAATRARRSSRVGSGSRRSRRPTIPSVGDWVVLEPDAGGTGPPRTRPSSPAVLPRRSAFRRSAADSNRRTAGLLADEQVIAANVDVALLVAGLDGDFNLRRLERYLAVAWSSGVTPGRGAQQGRHRRRHRGPAGRDRGDRAGRARSSRCRR